MGQRSVQEVNGPDVIVIGAGIFGLSLAWSLCRAGASVRVLEASKPGAGASGGVVGALTPHAPARWRPMMAFQFSALCALPDRIAEIEAASGLATGYAQTGRLTPLSSTRARERAQSDAIAAPETWGDLATYEVLDQIPDEAAGWIAPEAATSGVVHDSLSARVDPRRYVAALAASLGDTISAQTTVLRVNTKSGSIDTTDGLMQAGAIVVAAGSQGWDLLAPVFAPLRGTAVKGQAAVLAVNASGLPVLYQDGLYIIPHADGRVAVGSTSEKRFESPGGTDGLLDDVLTRARAVCPALRDAPVVERWAGLRPNPPGREPVVGRVPGSASLWVMGGGYKISFGIAHAVGDALAAQILGTSPPIPLPDSFDPAHLAERA